MIFEVYSKDKDYTGHYLQRDTVYFESIKELIAWYEGVNSEVVYAKEIIGSDQINEFRERYMRWM